MIELMVATTLLLAVSGIVMSALGQLRSSQRTISNRTAMHSGIRGATELLQQEIGQAGLVGLPGSPTLTNNVVASAYCDGADPSVLATPVTVSSTEGMFADMVLTTLDGEDSETVRISTVDSDTSITACFINTHDPGVKLTTRGGFAMGIVADVGVPNGSDGWHLKMFGDMDGDGKLKYIEYTCDLASGNLYRQVLDFDAPVKPAPAPQDILLTNLVPNPGNPACFEYERRTYQALNLAPPPLFTFVVNVAVTLTVETEEIDPITNDKQRETKALLNVSPRNVVDTYKYASLGYYYRIQSTPTNIFNTLLAPSAYGS
jgi:type II secretory pathway pseudopilin PulG